MQNIAKAGKGCALFPAMYAVPLILHTSEDGPYPSYQPLDAAYYPAEFSPINGLST